MKTEVEPVANQEASAQNSEMRSLLEEIFQETAPGRLHADDDSYLPPNLVLKICRTLGKHLTPQDERHLQGDLIHETT